MIPTKPGQVVSVDQLVSPTPGLIAQMTGFLTKQRYKYATVYIDQASGQSFIHLQKSASTSETLESKAAFEQYDSQNYSAAINSFQSLLRENPQDINLNFYLGLSYLGAGQPENAIPYLKDIGSSSHPYQEPAQWYLALSYLKMGEVESGKATLLAITNSSSAYRERAAEILEVLP